MKNALPVVTFREINRALKPRSTESIAKTEQVLATEVRDDPGERARMLAGFANALKILDDEEKVPGILVAPDHKVASLLQTFLARQAAETGRLEPLTAGGEEAKFDERDWAGWVGSFFSWWK